MKLKKSFLLIIYFAVFLIACKNENQTTINITVKNKAGILQADLTVYEFEYPDYEKFGGNPNYANTQRITDKNGKAVFILEGYEFDKSKTENILYLTVFNENTGTAYTTAGTISVNFEEGDIISKDLILNR